MIALAGRASRRKTREGEMLFKNLSLLFGFAIFVTAWARAEEANIIWSDASCGYFVVKLPEGAPDDAYGLFSRKENPTPIVGDSIEGTYLVNAEEVDALNKRTGDAYALIHWANAKAPEMLLRTTPVQCASRWKKKK
jgi:hypothetical protein